MHHRSWHEWLTAALLHLEGAPCQPTGAFHVWRQRFPDGEPEQITFGWTQEEGLTIDPDGRSLLTSVGQQQSVVWLRQQDSERQISLEGFS
jgi:eukaryotic-like serine/threonine-protein kinase